MSRKKRNTWLRDGYGLMRWGWAFVLWSVGVVTFVAVGAVGIRSVAHTVDEAKCTQWARVNSTVEVQFEDWNYFDWECLARDTNGVWVPVEQWRVEG